MIVLMDYRFLSIYQRCIHINNFVGIAGGFIELLSLILS
jgi:hypothetical protein